jgi:transcriptional regulator with XRE-family HTH domain
MRRYEHGQTGKAASLTVQVLSSIHHALREMRWSAGLTQQELAERSGLSTRTISDIERGYVARPRAATLRLLARAMDMSKDEAREIFLLAHRGGRS